MSSTKRFAKSSRQHRRDLRLEERLGRNKQQIHYGSEEANVVYGRRTVREYRGNDHGSGARSKYPIEFLPLEAQVKKAEELLKAVRSPHPDWLYATELFGDLTNYEVSLFSNRSFYEGFLTDVGSIITQQLPVRVELRYQVTSRKGRIFRIPVGYEIMPYRGHTTTATELKDSSATRPKQPYVNRPVSTVAPKQLLVATR